jgi:hypothetical protein
LSPKLGTKPARTVNHLEGNASLVIRPVKPCQLLASMPNFAEQARGDAAGRADNRSTEFQVTRMSAIPLLPHCFCPPYGGAVQPSGDSLVQLRTLPRQQQIRWYIALCAARGGC